MEDIVMSLIFSATSLDECLKKASEELNISKEALNYKVIKESRLFFKSPKSAFSEPTSEDKLV